MTKASKAMRLERCREYDAKRRLVHREKIKARKKIYRQKHKESIAAYQKKWRSENREYVSFYTRLWQIQNPDKYKPTVNRKQRKQRIRLADDYIKVILRDNGKPVTQESIKLCKQRIQLHRSRKTFKLMAAAGQLSTMFDASSPSPT